MRDLGLQSGKGQESPNVGFAVAVPPVHFQVVVQVFVQTSGGPLQREDEQSVRAQRVRRGGDDSVEGAELHECVDSNDKVEGFA